MSISRDYDAFRKTEFCRRIPDSEWDALQEKLATIDKRQITEVAIEAFKKGFWNDPIYKVDNWVLLAMECYLQKQLDEDQMSKLALYDACLTYGNWTTPRQAYPCLLIDMFLCDHLQLFHPNAIVKLLLAINNLPKEYTQYFEVGLRVRHNYTLRNFFEFKFHPFMKWDGNYFVQLQFPPKLARIIHKVLFGERAVQSIPVLGYFKKESLSHLDKRVASLALGKHVTLPEKLEGYNVNPLIMYYHDTSYHTILDGSNVHRPIFFQMAPLFKKRGETKIMITLYDGEFGYYRSRIYPDSPVETFQGKPIATPEDCFFATLLSDVLPRFNNLTIAIDTLLEFLKDNADPLNLDNFREFVKGLSSERQTYDKEQVLNEVQKRFA